MGSLVTAVEVKDWDKGAEGIVKVSNVTFDDGRTIAGYDLPSQPEISKPLPDGWEVATSKAGKPYIKVPKPGKPPMPAAFRNTERGFLLEQDSIHRSVALQAAVSLADKPGATSEVMPWPASVTAVAQHFYEWLRTPTTAVQSLPAVADKGAAGPALISAPAPTLSAGRSRAGRPADKHEAGGEPGDMGKVEPAPSAPCDHEWTDTKPDGTDLPRTFGRCTRCGLVMKGAFA